MNRILPLTVLLALALALQGGTAAVRPSGDRLEVVKGIDVGVEIALQLLAVT